MKKIAIILFIIFSSVQVVPAVMAVFADNTSVFVCDEEKGNNVDKKEKKDFATCITQSAKITAILYLVIQLTEKIQTSPYLEQVTPPPNFC